jgi:hypothetical protein
MTDNPTLKRIRKEHTFENITCAANLPLPTCSSIGRKQNVATPSDSPSTARVNEGHALQISPRQRHLHNTPSLPAVSRAVNPSTLSADNPSSLTVQEVYA